MLKTSVSILLILLCVFMQYARQLAYLECKIENNRSKEPVCDCEKKYANEPNTENGQLPQQKNHVHLSLDEFDEPTISADQLIFFHQTNHFFSRNISFDASYSGSIFHPPQS